MTNHLQKLPTNRYGAKRHGVSRYFTGKPCKHGHTSDRHACSGQCVECIKLKRHGVGYRSRRADARREQYRKSTADKLAALAFGK